jgi:hypothetical protein
MPAEALTLNHPLVWGMFIYSVLALGVAWGLSHARRVLMRQTRRLTRERDRGLTHIRKAKIQLYEGLDRAETVWEQIQAVLGIVRVLSTSALLNRTLYRLVPPLRQFTLARLLIPRALAEGWKRLGRP